MVLAMQRPDAEILTGEARENFGQRTSMGPLSPEGATMMWNNPVTGVTLPRGRIGRAIGLSSAGIPVEMQCYRVPDPKDTIPGSTEHELLMSLRPAESKQERLVIVPPQIDWDAEEPIEPTFTDYARAEWVPGRGPAGPGPLGYPRGRRCSGHGRAQAFLPHGVVRTYWARTQSPGDVTGQDLDDDRPRYVP
jgi:S-DNA-T family DNA segregation ATPase FtsK/SpoIIIE